MPTELPWHPWPGREPKEHCQRAVLRLSDGREASGAFNKEEHEWWVKDPRYGWAPAVEGEVVEFRQVLERRPPGPSQELLDDPWSVGLRLYWFLVKWCPKSRLASRLKVW
jgi:hypothetical protein